MSWLVEEGIGEDRAVLLSDGNITAARVDWPGALAAGQIADARLVHRAAGSTRGTASFASGEQALVDRLPRDAREGAPMRLEITRAAIAERGRTKLAHARPSDSPVRPAPRLAERLRNEGHEVSQVHRLPPCGWDELIAEALEGEMAFAGGTLLFSPTPAMTLIDIDGAGDPRGLAQAAVPAIAAALRRFDLGGPIAIDFPSLSAKDDRRKVGIALEEALAGWAHERTAMNGFGLVQIVARLERPSLLHLAAFRRTGFIARALLRRAEALEGAGSLLLIGHPTLQPALRPEWLEELARRTGRMVHWEARPDLAIEAPHAQLIRQ